ncbi:hypothetical protein [Massilia sp. CF038]|uniref:hypothetical protein n=1 Tax=Massilia sp. CF038 TaxID=1881045 RepID=UPI000922BFF3|nr:hypothetical protein [Massilia sp. CF038]SHG76440.1 hypothetical protein SAMN05428948_1938 [Massilia sp. CF038]
MKEFAKFFTGVAANQALTHGALAAAGVQFSLFGISYDQRINTTSAIVWAVLVALLIYYAWGKR